MSTIEVGTPTGCIQDKPNNLTVELAGKPINILAISRQINIDQSYICKILRGKKAPTLDTALKIAASLGMTVDEMYAAIQERAKEIESHKVRVVQRYFNRIIAEDTEDLDKLKKGGIPLHRIPGSRL